MVYTMSENYIQWSFCSSMPKNISETISLLEMHRNQSDIIDFMLNNQSEINILINQSYNKKFCDWDVSLTFEMSDEILMKCRLTCKDFDATALYVGGNIWTIG